MTGFDCILVPLDGSERAETALTWASALPARRVRLLRVCPVGHPDSQSAAQYLDEVAARFRPPGSTIETRIAHGGAAEVIVDDAADAGGALQLSCEDGTVLGATMVVEDYERSVQNERGTTTVRLEDGFYVEG